jgi:hypothetical protein
LFEYNRTDVYFKKELYTFHAAARSLQEKNRLVKLAELFG